MLRVIVIVIPLRWQMMPTLNFCQTFKVLRVKCVNIEQLQKEVQRFFFCKEETMKNLWIIAVVILINDWWIGRQTEDRSGPSESRIGYLSIKENILRGNYTTPRRHRLPIRWHAQINMKIHLLYFIPPLFMHIFCVKRKAQF